MTTLAMAYVCVWFVDVSEIIWVDFAGVLVLIVRVLRGAHWE